MGFNKRFLTEDGLKSVFWSDGYDRLLDYVRKPDALFIRDEFSEKVYDLIQDETIKEEYRYIQITHLMTK
jgi:hypothetical protein